MCPITAPFSGKSPEKSATSTSTARPDNRPVVAGDESNANAQKYALHYVQCSERFFVVRLASMLSP